MKKTFIALAAFSLMISACSDNGKTQVDNAAAASATAAALCNNSALPDQVRAAVQKGISEMGHQAAQQDTRQWLDGTQSANMAMQLDVRTNHAQISGSACQAEVSIIVPVTILETATANAPLFQAAPPIEYIQQNTQNGNIRFSDNTLTFPFNYTAQETNGQFSFTPNDANLNGSIKILGNALLTYAVKDTIVFDGRKMSRQAALKQLANPQPLPIASAPAAMPAEVPAISENNGNTTLETASATVAPEVLTPEVPKARISNSELEQAKNANNEAGQSIKSAWRKIPADIQESLVQEQRTWESKKQQSCRKAGSKGNDAAESAYLQMQCDTRMTRERIQYLNGFSID